MKECAKKTRRKPIIVAAMSGAQARFSNQEDGKGGIYIRLDRRGGATILLTMAMAHQVTDIYNEESKAKGSERRST